MYLHHTTLRQDGKVHRYWRLVLLNRVGIVQRMRLDESDLPHIMRIAFEPRFLQKCSANFLANLLICLNQTPDFAQVGLDLGVKPPQCSLKIVR